MIQNFLCFQTLVIHRKFWFNLRWIYLVTINHDTSGKLRRSFFGGEGAGWKRSELVFKFTVLIIPAGETHYLKSWEILDYSSLSRVVCTSNLKWFKNLQGCTLAVPSCTLSQQLSFALGFVSLASWWVQSIRLPSVLLEYSLELYLFSYSDIS